MASLSDYLDLTDSGARAQWQRISTRQRRPGKRQEAFLPVETILCYGLFFVVNPHQHGGFSRDRMPEVVDDLAELFKRPPNSLTNKMLNLDGTHAHAAKFDRPFFIEMDTDSMKFLHLYQVAMRAAREFGHRPSQLPDFLNLLSEQEFYLLGQEELREARYEDVLDAEAERSADVDQPLVEQETTRLAKCRARIGQHKFAADVLSRFDYTCGFCGFAPRRLRGERLVIASHIKPWSVSSNFERLDPSNGIAACPTHDAAFDRGLITVNGGLRVHRSDRLLQSSRTDPGVERYFGEALADSLLVPRRAQSPGQEYLQWHQEHVYRDPMR